MGVQSDVTESKSFAWKMGKLGKTFYVPLISIATQSVSHHSICFSRHNTDTRSSGIPCNWFLCWWKSIKKLFFVRFFYSQYFSCLQHEPMIKQQNKASRKSALIKCAAILISICIRRQNILSRVRLNFIARLNLQINILQPSSLVLSPLKLLSTMKCCFYDCDVKR